MATLADILERVRLSVMIRASPHEWKQLKNELLAFENDPRAVLALYIVSQELGECNPPPNLVKTTAQEYEQERSLTSPTLFLPSLVLESAFK